MKPEIIKDIDLDELRRRAPVLGRLVTNVNTYQDHISAMREINELLRAERATVALNAQGRIGSK